MGVKVFCCCVYPYIVCGIVLLDNQAYTAPKVLKPPSLCPGGKKPSVFLQFW